MKTWARFILNDGKTAVYECRTRDASCRLEITGDKVTRFYEGGPIPREDCVGALNELRSQEYAKFLDFAAKRNLTFDPAEYPPPVTLT